MADGDTTYNTPGPSADDNGVDLGSLNSDNTGAPPGITNDGTTTGGGVTALLKSLGLGNLSLSPNVLAALASIAPALISAKKQWDLSGQMLDYGSNAAGKYDPFGSQRGQYQQKLSALMANPDSIKDTPGYQFALKQGLGAVAGRDNRSFGLGAGSTSKDMMDYAQGLASKTYNDTISQLSSLSGSQFGPTGQSLDVAGMQANVALKNQALQSLFAPLGIAMAPQPNVTNVNANGGNGGGGPAGTTGPNLRPDGTVGGTTYRPGPTGPDGRPISTGGGNIDGTTGDNTGPNIVDASGRPIFSGGSGGDPWGDWDKGPGE
jgi:hypothetical protein